MIWNNIKNRTLILIFLILFLTSVVYAECKEDPDFGTVCDSPQEELQYKINNNVNSVPSSDLAKYPDVAKNNWNKLNDNQKNDLYKNHLDTFKGKFSEYWKQQGVDVTVTDGSKYDPDTKVLTHPNPDGSSIIDRNLLSVKKSIRNYNSGPGHEAMLDRMKVWVLV